MIFIARSWSPNMTIEDNLILDYHRIDEKTFKDYSAYAHSCLDKQNLARILNVEYNPEHVQLRSGDVLLAVHVKGGKLLPHMDELPADVIVEYYCYKVYSKETHVILEKQH